MRLAIGCFAMRRTWLWKRGWSSDRKPYSARHAPAVRLRLDRPKACGEHEGLCRIRDGDIPLGRPAVCIVGRPFSCAFWRRAFGNVLPTSRLTDAGAIDFAWQSQAAPNAGGPGEVHGEA
jgi:hypothetical protein